MRMLRKIAGFSVAAVAVCQSAPGSAQDRTDDNAITQAEDAFGFSVGRESIGIYNAGQARGFSPTSAGNVRIEGLYFDPIFGLQSTLVDSTSIKVGLSAQGYPFVAPSGIVDQGLRRPNDKLGASFILNADDWGTKGAEMDASLPVTGRLGFRVGLNVGGQVFPNGTDNFNHTESVIARWRPIDGVEIMPFWAMYNDYDDESGTFYIPAGDYIPPVDRAHHDESPRWADVRFTGTNAGALTSVSFAKTWVARLGVFRSSLVQRDLYTHLLVDDQPDGTAERILISYPEVHNHSLSGEARLTHSIAEGPRLHLFHLSARRRDARREFGGEDAVSFGIGRVGERVTDPPPHFHFGPKTQQHVEQLTYGVAYDGRWKDVGEISVGLSRANYRKDTDIPSVGRVTAESRPWLYNGTAAVVLSQSINLYAGYAKGLEESGTAPFTAANRNEPLETILTQQKDAGVRIGLANGMNAVVGVFDLTRPYFGFDTDNVYRRIGSVLSRGAEFSVSGKPVPKLSVVLGGVLLKPRVEASADAVGEIGKKPVNLPSHIVNFNANWETSFLKGLQLDAGLSHRGKQAITTNNHVFLPAKFNLNLGLHYGFELASQTAAFRLQMVNVLDNRDPTPGGPGIFGPPNSRLLQGYLTVDI